jgi:hypothetical protein
MSTLIVLAAAVAIAGYVNRDLIRVKIASVYARVAPKAGTLGKPAAASEDNLDGDAPWALSALPECLLQVSHSSGSPSYVRAHLPVGAVPIDPPDNLTYGDCRITLRDWQAFVRRGRDRFRIPPIVRFFHVGNRLAMLRQAGGSADLRVYEPVTP